MSHHRGGFGIRPLAPIFRTDKRLGMLDVGNDPPTLPAPILQSSTAMTWSFSNAGETDFDVAREYLYIGQRTGSGNGTIHAWDIANPASPSSLGTVSTPADDVHGLVYDPTRQLIWVTRSVSDALTSVDASNPAAMAFTGNALTGGGMSTQRNEVFSSGNIIAFPYSTTGSGNPSIYVADVTNLAAKTMAGGYNAGLGGGSGYDCSRAGNQYLAFSRAAGGLLGILDITTNPAVPSLVWSITSGYNAGGMTAGTPSRVYYCENGTSNLIARNVLTGAIEETIPTFMPTPFLVRPSTERNHIVLWTATEVSVVDVTVPENPIVGFPAVFANAGVVRAAASSTLRLIALSRLNQDVVDIYSF